jgi:glycosyltransferase involved in cell wall biosynthesis
MRPWLSILTVVKDDASGLARSLESIQRQDLQDVEVVVVDSSADRSNIEQMAKSSIRDVVYHWTQPQGIYPAMNLGLEMAKGSFAYFLNAGDVFFRDDVVRKTRTSVSYFDWAFGPVEIVEVNGSRVFTPPWNYEEEEHAHFSRGFFPAHQGTFVRRDLALRLGGFDTSFGVAADYAMALALSRLSKPFLLPFVVASFYEGGASTQNWSRAVLEFHRARREILHPAGYRRLVEGVNTARHWSTSWLVRKVRPKLSGDPS